MGDTTAPDPPSRPGNFTSSALRQFRAVGRLLIVPLCIVRPVAAFADAEPFPPPAELRPSPHFQVEVQTASGWQPSYVNHTPARADGSGARDQPGRSMSWTTFFADGPAQVRVTSTAGVATDVVVRPSRLGIQARPIGNDSVEFSMEPGQKVSVEFAGTVRDSCFTGPPHGIPCIMHGLLLFADKTPSKPPLGDYVETEIAMVFPGQHAKVRPVEGLDGGTAHQSTLGNVEGRRAVRFMPGVHQLGYWQIPNSIEHIHLDPGAFVFGALDVLPAGRGPHEFDIDQVYRDAWPIESLRPRFGITGHGILSGARLPWHLKKDFSYDQHDHYWSHVKLVQLAARSVELRDVTLVDAPYWSVTFLNDADARTRGHFENFKIVGSWTYNNDGLPVPAGPGSIVRDAFIHANDDAFKVYHSNARIENCVVWQGNNGAVFQFGWFPKTVRNVRVRGIDVIHDENWYGVGQSNRALINYADAGGEGTIEDVTFDDVVVEGRILRLFGIKALGGQKLRNFSFQNLKVDGLGSGRLGAPGRNYFIGDVQGFHFEKLFLGGERVINASMAWFEFSPEAGQGFTFEGQPITNRPKLSVADDQNTGRTTPEPTPRIALTPTRNLLRNPRFVKDAAGWKRSTGRPLSIENTDGHVAAHVPAQQWIEQDITDILRSRRQATLTFGASVQAATAMCTVKVTIVIEDRTGRQLHPSPDVTAEPGLWNKVGRTHKLKVDGLKRALLRVESGGANPGEFFVRNVWLNEGRTRRR